MKKTQVLLLFGGESTEHDVSIMSARNIYSALDSNAFDVQLGYIDRNGRWFALESFDEHTDTSKLPRLLPLLGEGSFQVGGSVYAPSVILPALHGKNGEDGSVQGLAQLLHIPIVGCDMTSSAAGMDKVIAKRIASQIGIDVVPYIVHRRGDNAMNYEQVRQELGDTLFVKPSRAGSSVGVSKVHDSRELQLAIEQAFAVDDTVLVERAMNVRELEVAALGNPPHHRLSQVGEVLPGEDFYSYDDKYDQASASAVRIPADIPDSVAEKVRQHAGKLFAEIGASGLARIDFFLTDDNTLYFNEINTLPGFTDISMYPKLWEDSGLGYQELLSELIAHASSR